MATIDEAFQIALQYHQSGALSKAEELYARIVQAAPEHARAWHLLGVLAHQSGRNDQAIEIIRRAIGMQPADPAFYNNLGEAYRAQGRLEEAKTCYREALRLRPDYAETQNNLGNALQQAGQMEEALAHYRCALRLEPNFVEAFNNEGSALQHLGRWEEARASFYQALRLKPNYVEANYNLGVVLLYLDELDEARARLQQALRLRPDFALAHNDLGNVLHRQGQLDEALASYERALRLNPDLAEAHNNMGNVFYEQGRLDESAARYLQALRLRPGAAEIRANLGVALQKQGKVREAEACQREALRLRPDFADAHGNLGNILKEQGKLAEATACYREAIRLRPDYADAYFNLGNVFKEREKLADAEACYREALKLRPGSADVLNNLGNILHEQGLLEEAAAQYVQAIRLEPSLAGPYVNLGNILKYQGRLAEASACYRRALQIDDQLPDAYNNLGLVLLDQGQRALALDCFAQALALAPHDGLKIKSALALPVINESAESIRHERDRLERALDQLLEEKLSLDDPPLRVGMTHFHLAYQGMNDRDLQAKIAALYARAAPALGYVAPHCQASTQGVEPGRPIRVGFISKFFFGHSVASFYSGVIRLLDRERFHVFVFRLPGPSDPTAEFIRESADRVVTLAPYLDSARRQIAQEELDVLFYTDIGMDPWTYFLAFARLAPVQCAGSGHPVTTGIPTIDYFLSCEDMEPADADAHYTEKLVRMQEFPFYFYRPQTPFPAKARGDFGLDDRDHLYVCAQTLFKVHPEFDGIVAKILRADPEGRVVFFHAQLPEWGQLLLERFHKTIPDVVDRIQILPRQSSEDFQHVLARADVLLDTIHFSGGTTSFKAFAAGTPIVTLPSPLMRGRVTYACYRKMGIFDCVARDPDDYVLLAVALGTDPEGRELLRTKILAANHVLFNNPAGVRALERFFLEAVAQTRNAMAPK